MTVKGVYQMLGERGGPKFADLYHEYWVKNSSDVGNVESFFGIIALSMAVWEELWT